MKKVLLLLIVIIFLASCKTIKENTQIDYSDAASRLCENMCNGAKMKGGVFSNGPCLVDSFEQYPDWSCDMVHSPRQDVDNQKQNQCPSFINGKTHHFVEVDTDCRIVRIV